MNVLRRHLSIGLIAAVAAGITWVSASGVVVLYPATIDGTLTLSSESVTSIRAEFYPTAGGEPATKTSPGPSAFDLTVDGGPPEGSGVSYRPSLYAYLQNPVGSQTYLRIYRNNSILVEPSATLPVSFSYPTTHRANVTIAVEGGTISSYYIYAYANKSTLNESYNARSYGSASAQSSITNWVPMVPSSSVSVYATVYVVNGQGVTSQRSLATEPVDLSAGNADVSWTIDLNNTGNLEGELAVVAALGSTATTTGYQVYYQGVSQSSSGIYGSISVSPGQPHYSVALTPGEYDVYLRTSFSNPSQYSETESTRVTIVAGDTVYKNFTDSFGVARVALDVSGFFNVSDLQSAQLQLRSPTYRHAEHYATPSTAFNHTVPVGTWRSQRAYWRIYDVSNPDLPNNNQMYRYNYNNLDAPAVAVAAAGITPLGTESFTLVKSNVYFDVTEAPGQDPVNVSSPQIYAYKYDYNADQTLRQVGYVYSYGSSTASPVSALTMVAEPGTYVLDARASVNGTLTPFGGTTITFGEPVETPAGTGTETVLTPAQNPELKLTLTFDEVQNGGITTVVETPLGPAPPEGFRSVCIENELEETCDPIYYDISSTASWTGSTKVCVRRQFPGVANVAAEYLRLFHYDEVLQSWEELPPPPDGVQSFDCSGDPSVCGCADEASCGIDPEADPPLQVFLVCGMTTSFSPFAIFQGKAKFSNEVDGIEYTGPTGPPSLQQWVVPGDGTYRITAIGAQGASATNSPARKGGCGAEVTGDFALQEGDVVEILVGQKGTAAPGSGGGGGGSFVIKHGSPLVIGGGGGGVRSGALVDGRPGTLSTSGTAGSTSSSYASGFIAGGTGGAGGSRASSYGAGGGGWSGNGASDGSYGEGGFSFLGANQAQGGLGKSCGAPAHGGYGGGGAGNGCYGGGGGGGYSGGGGGRVGGGGGSLNNGANPTGNEGTCTQSGHGIVTIDLLR